MRIIAAVTKKIKNIRYKYYSGEICSSSENGCDYTKEKKKTYATNTTAGKFIAVKMVVAVVKKIENI